jgi:hypothetical protein
MAASKKEYLQCSHCGRKNRNDQDGADGFSVREYNMGLQISCPCGIMTKICKTDLHLKAVWNSRPKKLVTVPKVEVK